MSIGEIEVGRWWEGHGGDGEGADQGGVDPQARFNIDVNKHVWSVYYVIAVPKKSWLSYSTRTRAQFRRHVTLKASQVAMLPTPVLNGVSHSKS